MRAPVAIAVLLGIAVTLVASTVASGRGGGTTASGSTSVPSIVTLWT